MDPDLPSLSFRIPLLVLTFCLSAFFSGSETALFSFQPHELKRMKDAHGADGLVARLRSRPKRLLITVLFGNMVVNVVFFSVSFLIISGLEHSIGRGGVLALNLGALVAIIIGGEVMPKNLAVTLYRQVGRLSALPLWVLQICLLPLIYPLERVTDVLVRLVGSGDGHGMRPEELEMLVDLSAREGVVDRRAGEMLTEVIGLSDVRIRELMVPRVEMVSFDLNESPERLAKLFQEEKLTMMPVYDGQEDDMRGVVHIKDVLFRGGRNLRELVRPIPFLPETATVEEALLYCQRERSKTDFVVDEYGAVVGLITVEDLLEEVVGEIADEYDSDDGRPFEALGGGQFRVRGRLGLRVWQEVSGVAVPEMGVDTVGGLVMTLLGRVPEVGDTARLDMQEFTVEAVQGRTAARVLVKLLSEGGTGEEGPHA